MAAESASGIVPHRLQSGGFGSDLRLKSSQCAVVLRQGFIAPFFCIKHAFLDAIFSAAFFSIYPIQGLSFAGGVSASNPLTALLIFVLEMLFRCTERDLCLLKFRFEIVLKGNDLSLVFLFGGFAAVAELAIGSLLGIGELTESATEISE